VKRLEFYGGLFADYRIVLFENDSSDRTRECAKQWSNTNKKVNLIECEGIEDCKYKSREQYGNGILSHERINRMKWAREQYLNVVKTKYNEYDYMMVYDFDLDGNMCIDGLFETLAFPEWDAVFCNGRNPVPGTFGLKTFVYDGSPFVECDEPFKYNIMTGGKMDLVNGYLNMLRIAIKVDNSKKYFIKVNSAFNGVGIYKINASLLNASYVNGPSFLCEHTILHYTMNTNRMYISKNWIGYFPLQGPKGNQIVNFF